MYLVDDIIIYTQSHIQHAASTNAIAVSVNGYLYNSLSSTHKHYMQSFFDANVQLVSQYVVSYKFIHQSDMCTFETANQN